MPIRFRCPHCNRLLGIARRKTGTQLPCPQCGRLLTVPGEDDGPDLDEIDVLLNPAGGGNGSPVPRIEPPQPVAAPAATPRPVPVPQPVAKPPESIATPRPQPARKPLPNRETPLLEMDVDALLGLGGNGQKFELDDEPASKATPVSGLDAMSLGDDPRGLVLSPQKATLLVVAVVVLLGIAFASGFLLASNL